MVLLELLNRREYLFNIYVWMSHHHHKHNWNTLMILFASHIKSLETLDTLVACYLLKAYSCCLPNTCRRKGLVARIGKSAEHTWLFTCVDQAQCLDNRLISRVASQLWVPSAYLQLPFPTLPIDSFLTFC
jgi:hypothetical protein